MTPTLFPSIFTIEIGGKPTVTFEAKSLREASEICNAPWRAVLLQVCGRRVQRELGRRQFASHEILVAQLAYTQREVEAFLDQIYDASSQQHVDQHGWVLVHELGDHGC